MNRAKRNAIRSVVAIMFVFTASCSDNPGESTHRASVESDQDAGNQNQITASQFQSAVSTCAAGIQVSVDGELRGAIAQIYEGATPRVDANGFIYESVTKFLEWLPPEDRLEGFKIYQECISKILNPGGNEDSEITEVYEIPETLVTFGEPLHIRAKTIIAPDSEIRAFPSGSRGENGRPGNPGSNGGNGHNGSGGAGGSGGDGTAGTAGTSGADAGEIRIEAEQLIGRLKIVNSGMSGGAGGRGGKGGNGGRGGKGRNSVSGVVDCSSGPGNGGSGGNAGNGGDGGVGGSGGNGGLVVVKLDKVEPGSLLTIVSNGGAGGPGGIVGASGQLGGGGPRGNTGGRCGSGGRGPGSPGAGGNPGVDPGPGTTGIDGQIEVEIGGRVTVTSGSYSKLFE